MMTGNVHVLLITMATNVNIRQVSIVYLL
jgi:hypothetical protein